MLIDGKTSVESDLSRADYYAHLIGGAGPDLEPMTCIYLDCIADDFPIGEILEAVERLFARENCKPKLVLVGKKTANKSPSRSMKWIRSTIKESGEQAFRRSFDSLQFFPKGRSTIEATWWPPVYAALSVKIRASSAFICVNKLQDEAWIIEQIRELDALYHCRAAYGFWFPKIFSPLGYYWGISVNPGWRREGAWATRESRRLSHWRDNTQIGILSDDVRRFYTACNGYVRDAYPLMLLSVKHMERRVGKTSLVEVVKQRQLGSVTLEGEKFLWRVPPEKLAEAQKLLDDHNISLSGRRLE